MNIHTYVYIYIYMYVYICIYLWIYKYTYLYIWIYIYMYVYIYIRIYMYIYICIYIYIYMYEHVDIFICILDVCTRLHGEYMYITVFTFIWLSSRVEMRERALSWVSTRNRMSNSSSLSASPSSLTSLMANNIVAFCITLSVCAMYSKHHLQSPRRCSHTHTHMHTHTLYHAHMSQIYTNTHTAPRPNRVGVRGGSREGEGAFPLANSRIFNQKQAICFINRALIPSKQPSIP